MNSSVLVLFLAVGLSSAALQCYNCTGGDAACPKVATDAQIAKFTKQSCNGTLAHICAKYSIDLLNGDSITYRSCEPPYVGGTSKDGPEFCTFITSLFTPLATGGLISAINCDTCNTVECNT